jgi:methionyl-tRNA formyltransferase
MLDARIHVCRIANDNNKTVPIHDFATSIDLPTHPIDTFTNWHPPPNTSLIIAVSFGLLIPPRILSHSKHGGINLHPSLLPDLRGPAPIEHAILRGRTHTGVSIQTLHPTQFDRGVVLAQTEAPGIQLTEEMTRAELEGVLATKGADMLVQVLKNGAYISPHTTTQGHDDGSGNPGSWYTGPISHAPKITKADRAIILPEHSLAHILAIHRALGDMWCIFLGERVLIHRVVSAGEEGKKLLQSQGPGMWTREGIQWPLFKAKCGGVGYVLESTYAGGKKGQGNNKVMRMLKERGGGEVSGCDVHA